MNNQRNGEPPRSKNDRDTAMLYGAGGGVALGAGVGAALGDVAIGAGIGTALGAAVGTAWAMIRKDKRPK